MESSQRDTDAFHLRIQWCSLLAFCSIWSYGFVKFQAFLPTPALTVFLILLFSYFYWMGRRKAPEPGWVSEFPISRREAWIYAGYAAFFLIVSAQDLSATPNVDEFYHTQMSHYQMWPIARWLLKRFPSLGKSSAGGVLTMVGCAFLAVSVALWGLAKKYGGKYGVWALGILAILIFERKFNAQGDVHPPLRNFPLWLSSSILGVRSFAYRLPQCVALIGVAVISQRAASRKLHWGLATLYGLAVATIPVFWHTGTLVEFSIWSGLCVLATLFYFHEDANAKGPFKNGDRRPESYVPIFSLISLLALVRQPAFLLAVPVGALFAWQVLKIPGREAKLRALLCASPLAFMALFILRSLVQGTPSTSPVTSKGLFDFAAMVEWVRITGNDALRNIPDKSGPIWIWFLPLALLPTSLGSLARRAFFLAIFLLLFKAFYSTPPDVWMTGRYLAEYVAPFLALGLLNVCLWMSKQRTYGQIATGVLTSALIALNWMSFQSFHLLYYPERMSGIHFRTWSAVSKPYYDYETALQAAREDGHATDSVILHTIYGPFPQILAGYSFDETDAAQELNDPLQSAPSPLKQATSDPRVKLILFPSQVESIHKALEELGWKPWKTIAGPTPGEEVVGYLRPTPKD